jgi:hypothetical protein
MPPTPEQFAAKWKQANLTERAAAQSHFLDLCELLGQPKPADADPDGAWYTFERGVRKAGGGKGWADVWMRGHFAWEYKGRHKDLDADLAGAGAPEAGRRRVRRLRLAPGTGTVVYFARASGGVGRPTSCWG